MRRNLGVCFSGLLLAASCSVTDSRRALDQFEHLAPGADQVLSWVEPRLARVEAAVSGYRSGVEEIAAQRAAEGVPLDEKYGFEEILILLGTVGSAVLGLNVHRNRTRKQAMERKDTAA